MPRGAQRYGFEVEGYCLMPDHVHIVGVPRTETSLAPTIALINLLYTQYVNRLHKRTGGGKL